MQAPSGATPINLIDQLTPGTVMSWLPEALLDDARSDIERGRVARPAIRQSAVEAVVADETRGRVRVRIEWGQNEPVARCECLARRTGMCRHAAALALLLIGDAGTSGQRGGERDAPSGDPPLSLAEREIALRRERGASELFEVKRMTPRKGAGFYDRYEVRSPSSRSYEVIVRALNALHNSCSCPDFAINLLGTCKHIEAVLHRLRRRSPRRFEQAAKEGPPTSYLYLAFQPEPEVRLHLSASAGAAQKRLRARYFRSDGRLAVQPASPQPSAASFAALWPGLARTAAGAGIEIPPEVARFAERARDADERARREDAIEAEVRSFGVDQPGFRATLYPYQVEGVAFLVSRRRALLSDEMGLGKTAQAIAAMVRLLREGDVRRALIVCPASLKRQWEREIHRFTDLGEGRVAVVVGPREVRRKLYANPPDVLITSYELARADERDVVSLSPDLLIVDEAQRIKNWRTRTADVIKSIPSRCAFVLTGTPLENRLDDLYSLVQVVDPHLFGPLWRFNHDFTELDERGRVTGYKNLDQLRLRVSRVMRRRRKDEVMAQLPAQIVNRLMVPMTPEQAAIHDDAERQVSMMLARLKKRPLTPIEERRLFSAFQRMRMACDAAGLADKETRGAPKLDELAGLLEDLCVQGGHKVVVFSEWERMQAMAAAVCERLRLGHVRLHGGVPSDARGRLIQRFFEDPRCKVFLSTDAGGVGLNLQAASYVLNLDLPWNPAVLAQRIARVHRIGQQSSVNVILLISEKSFEERLEATLDAKRALFAAAVGDDAETTELARATLASRIETLMRGSFAASTGIVQEEVATAPDEVSVLRERLGDALERIVRLPNGRLLGVVRGEVAPAVDVPALLMPATAVEALLPLGDASPLAQAELLYRAEPRTPSDQALERRRARLAAGTRKLKAAEALVEAGLGVEALGLFREALALGCRAAAERADPGEDAAALVCAVYGELVPEGALTAEEAHALVRAGELARAFDAACIAPPGPLLADVARGARDLLARVRERLAPESVVAAAG